MIPFWKKTGKHSKPQSAQKRRQNAKPAMPRTAQQSIPMQRMFEDGTCRVKPNYYTRTIQYQDINYQLAQQEDKTAIFEEWCSFLNFFDSSIKFELSFVNMATDSTEFEKSIRIPFQKDGFDDVRAEYSQMLRQQLAKGNNGLTKTKFITFGVEGESMAQVKPRLDHIQNDLLNNFHRLGVQAKPLNGAQRLKLMHDMFNMDGASKFHFDWKDLVKSGLSVKDAIAPTAFAFKNSRSFQMGGIFCAASFLSITASDISDQLLKDFLDMDLPELMNMFKEAADIKTSDQLHLPVPEAKFETVVVKPSEIQQDMVKSLSERAAEVHSGAVDPSVDNMLKITSDGRKTGLDQRLMNPLTPDDPDSKLNACVDNVLRIWNETKEDNLTQLIFCDMSTPKGDGSFNVYDDIRTKLLAAGVPESEVEFIHNADTEGKKADLFSKVRSGKVRVLLGSTAKMGAGTNVQTLLVAVHHLDVGWRPSDMTQRNGRIIRQGNKNKQVYVYNYVTEGTFDSYLWQTLENKQKFISQIMTSKSPMRSCDDVDEQALSYAEVKALCAGDPRIREKMDLDVQVAKLKVLRSDYQNQKYRLEDKLLKHYPEEIQKAKNRIAALKNDAQIADAHPQDKENFCGMTIKGMVFDEKKAAGERLMLACKEMPNADMMLLGTYRGFELNIRFDSFKNEHQIVLRGELSYPVPLGDDPRGNIVRLDNAIGNFADRIADADAALDSLEQQKQAAEVEIAKPFAQEEELQTKSARLAELDALLNMEHQSSRTEPEAEEKPDARPSVLAALEEKADKVEPVRPFKSYLDKDGDAR